MNQGRLRRAFSVSGFEPAVAALFMSALLASACGSGAGKAPDVTAADFRGLFDAPADPIDVSPRLDAGRAVSRVISPEGGQISATAGDGTSFTLEVPKGALLLPETITMTPISAIDNLPLSRGLGGAVLLEPEGLIFYEDVTLSIRPAVEIPLSEQVPFGFGGDGRDFHMVPAMPVVEIRMVLLHFSGYGVGRGLNADRAEILRRQSRDAEARLSNQEAAIFMQWRQMALSGREDPALDSALRQALAELRAEYLERVVKPRLELASSSCDDAEQAIATLLGLERHAQVLGHAEGTGLTPGLEALLPDLFSVMEKKCLEEAYDECVRKHEFLPLTRRYLALARGKLLMSGNVEPEIALAALDAMAEPFFDKCFRYELEFASTAGLRAPDGGYESVTRSRVLLRATTMSALEPVVSGRAPLINDAFEYQTEGCSFTPVLGGGEFQVFELRFLPGEDGAVADVLMVYNPGSTLESATGHCPPNAKLQVTPAPYWTTAYVGLHFNEVVAMEGSAPVPSDPTPMPTSASFPGMPDPKALKGMAPLSNLLTGSPMGDVQLLARGWEVVGQELFARKVYERASPDGLYETTMMTLWHRPGE